MSLFVSFSLYLPLYDSEPVSPSPNLQVRLKVNAIPSKSVALGMPKRLGLSRYECLSLCLLLIHWYLSLRLFIAPWLYLCLVQRLLCLYMPLAQVTL